jgi:hypothetical protein
MDHFLTRRDGPILLVGRMADDEVAVRVFSIDSCHDHTVWLISLCQPERPSSGGDIYGRKYPLRNGHSDLG